MPKTPEEQVDALTPEQCREVLLRIVEAVHRNEYWEESIYGILDDWSLTPAD